MIDLWYLNTNSVGEKDVKALLDFLPQEMINGIICFRNHEDRRLKLFSRLMIKKYYEEQGLKFNWQEWQLSPGGKPYYNSHHKKFSISHSGDYVVVAFSDHEIGIDIEKSTSFDVTSILDYLHPQEVECIESSLNSEDSFFKVWTRKEAYLKAIGIGIIDGLKNENCLQNKITNKEKWYLHSLSLISNYQIAVCTTIHNCCFNTRELLRNEFQI